MLRIGPKVEGSKFLGNFEENSIAHDKNKIMKRNLILSVLGLATIAGALHIASENLGSEAIAQANDTEAALPDLQTSINSDVSSSELLLPTAPVDQLVIEGNTLRLPGIVHSSSSSASASGDILSLRVMPIESPTQASVDLMNESIINQNDILFNVSGRFFNVLEQNVFYRVIVEGDQYLLEPIHASDLNEAVQNGANYVLDLSNLSEGYNVSLQAIRG